MRTIGVLGATGNVGRDLAGRLIDAGQRPRLIVRNPEILDARLATHADIARADLRERDSVLRATEELDALFWFTPADLAAEDMDAHYRRVGDIAAEAVWQNGIKRVVQLSAAGADEPDFGVISGQGVVEGRLRSAARRLVILRPSYFYENFLRHAPTLAHEGVLYEPMPSGAVIPMIAATDIAEAAAARLLAPDMLEGVEVVELTGPESHTLESVLMAFGETLGRTFRHVRVPLEAVGEVFLRLGASDAAARAYVEMHRAFCEGRARPRPGPEVRVTSTSARTFAAGPLAGRAARCGVIRSQSLRRGR